MTVTVVALPLTTPPSMQVTCAVTTGNVMKTAALYRIDSGVPVLVRSQPSTGFDTRVVSDFEAPYGASTVYEFVSDYFDPAAITTVWAETWVDLTAWTGDVSSYAVSAGTVQQVAVHSDGSPLAISRAVASGAYRATIASIAGPSTASYPSGVWFPNLVAVISLTGNLVAVYDYRTKSFTGTAISSASPITVDFLGTSIVVSGTGGTFTLSGFTATNYSSVVISGSGASSGLFTVGAITISSYPVVTHVDQSSTPTTLSPVSAWMVHPSNPGLSMPISGDEINLPSIRGIGDISNGSAATEHHILGQSTPITTVSGPRFSNKLTVVLATKTRAQELSMNALLRDGSPLLVRVPTTFDIGFDEGFYSVGDVGRARQAQKPGNTWRDFTLPLTGVQSPIASVTNSGWSWAGLAGAFPTWAQVAAAFATWSDVSTNTRKPGF